MEWIGWVNLEIWLSRNQLRDLEAEIFVWLSHSAVIWLGLIPAFKQPSDNALIINPISSDIICSSTYYGEIHVWSLENNSYYINLKVDNNPTLVSWNPKGSLIGATTKIKYINIFAQEIEKWFWQK